eukprot:TRINITY_DN6663_c0_g1_i1.p1 TRINITY_DN6663_c0_g1~~TRINITY_DN6663_c0_g1_i1.p1  ORF type:complete len:417 (+),score=48.28 TRINITY_DN6663_c0_g1_i1:35-1285(+)
MNSNSPKSVFEYGNLLKHYIDIENMNASTFDENHRVDAEPTKKSHRRTSSTSFSQTEISTFYLEDKDLTFDSKKGLRLRRSRSSKEILKTLPTLSKTLSNPLLVCKPVFRKIEQQVKKNDTIPNNQVLSTKSNRKEKKRNIVSNDTQMEEDKGVVSAGDLEQFIARITDLFKPDPEFVKIFFYTYPYYTSSLDVLHQLQNRYEFKAPQGSTSEVIIEHSRRRQHIQERVKRTLICWITSYPHYWVDDELVKELKEWAIKERFLSEVLKLIGRITKATTSKEVSPTKIDIQPDNIDINIVSSPRPTIDVITSPTNAQTTSEETEHKAKKTLSLSLPLGKKVESVESQTNSPRFTKIKEKINEPQSSPSSPRFSSPFERRKPLRSRTVDSKTGSPIVTTNSEGRHTVTSTLTNLIRKS